MQTSEFVIRREVETLRDIRRRSTAQAGILDPDLPAVSSDATSPVGYWEDSSSSSHEGESDQGSSESDDPFHLYWVPARLHPEIAPAEFKAFLKEHAQNPAEGAAIGRSSSMSSTGLGRKKSMLSRQYNPSAGDGVEEEKVVIRRKRTSVLANPGPQLTISDLQKLEELVEEASESRDPSKLRSVLRRSLSLNVAPSVIDQMDDIPDVGDEADAPIIVPRPGQILRRAARTKIRKPGTSEGPHRFTATRARRGSAVRAATVSAGTADEPRTSLDRSSSDHSDEQIGRRRASSDAPDFPLNARPDSYSEESSIYDAYARDESDESESQAPLLVQSPPIDDLIISPQPQPPESPYEPQIVAAPVLHHPKPQRALSPPQSEVIQLPPVSTPDAVELPPQSPIESPQPDFPSQAQSPGRPPLKHEPQSVYQPTPPPQPAPSPSPSEQRREKDKKGLFGKWGGSDKGGKKGQRDQREKEKESGFFGSLFGGKKKQDDISPPPAGAVGNNGRETAAALLGASKSAKNHQPPPSPQPGVNGYSRYPIHVERAIYRLSHIKLANPRRPLYEQVLISNLMFWYLGVINNSKAQPQVNGNGQGAAVNGNVEKEKEQAEREKKEKEERERADREKAEKEKEKHQQAEQKRKGSLTKTPAPGHPNARRAEMPVRGPQYDMQHRAMEQEYNYQATQGQQPVPRSSSAPPVPIGYPQQHPNRGMQGSTVQLVQPQPQAVQNQYYLPPGSPQTSPQQYPTSTAGAPQLPPGAMPPASADQAWVSAQQPMARNQASPGPRPRTSPPPSANGSPPGARRARSPPGPYHSPAAEKQPQPYVGQGRGPSRSISASAAPPLPNNPQLNGKLRKGNSAHAVMAHQQRGSEEEDVPLAVYQQRRK